jgi:hypothetical protein
MKALALEFPFIILIAAILILVSISIIITIIKPELIPRIQMETDVRYACSKYNNSAIRFENFKTILYGFLKNRCNSFSAILEEGMSFDDITRAVKEIDEKVQVVEFNKCSLPETNTGNVYVCCKKFFGMGEKINITRREIKNSDVLICG